jgi:hypothetical protein
MACIVSPEIEVVLHPPVESSFKQLGDHPCFKYLSPGCI